MQKKIRICIIVSLVFAIAIVAFIFLTSNTEEMIAVKSSAKLEKIYNKSNEVYGDIPLKILTLPFSILDIRSKIYSSVTNTEKGTGTLEIDGISTETNNNFSNKDYSKTNIQVENVDEADIIKTDGNYIYSISGEDIIITNVSDIADIKIISKIKSNDDAIPNDIILYKDELVIINTKIKNNSIYNSSTIVKIYDISDKEKPIILKKYELPEPYYTSRCIDNKLYVIASGNLKKENNKIITYYNEDSIQKEIGYENIKYLKDLITNEQTIISFVDLNSPKEDVNVKSYIMDISNAYVSENSIYLLDKEYNYSYNSPPISSLFGVKGAIGPFIYENDLNKNSIFTKIYKFNIEKDGNIEYQGKVKIEGQTINQYSLDEDGGHLRVALYDANGARISVLDEKLNEIGTSEYVAEGERMYSSRFIGDKAYLVTYKTIDPLFVFDLSDETKPKVLGELKIPGYSTYLHPYDENYLIGIRNGNTGKYKKRWKWKSYLYICFNSRNENGII